MVLIRALSLLIAIAGASYVFSTNYYDPFYLSHSKCCGEDFYRLIFEDRNIVLHYDALNHQQILAVINKARKLKMKVAIDNSKLVLAFRYIGPLQNPIRVPIRHYLSSDWIKQAVEISDSHVTFQFIEIARENIKFVRDSFIPFDTSKKYEIAFDEEIKTIWLSEDEAKRLQELCRENTILINKTVLKDFSRFVKYVDDRSDLFRRKEFSIN